jgi:hypothetical protein
MKKLFLTFLLIIFMISNVFAFNIYNYLGKDVVIVSRISMQYIGKITDIFELKRCAQRDGFNNCIYEIVDYIIVLKQYNGEKITLNAKNISSITEK